MKQAVWKIGLVVCMVMLSMVLGCAKPPTQEMADAAKAIADAKAKEADLYVQDMFTKAQDELKKATDLVTAKKFDEAKTAALEATKMVQQAAALVEENKQKMKMELETMLPNIQKSLDEMKTLAATAIKKKAVPSKDELQSAIGKLELDMTAVKEQLQTGKIKQAMDLAKSLLEQANTQKQALTDAIAQLKPAKK